MEEVERYFEDITQMWRFVEEFSAQATLVFKVKRVRVSENAQFGGPLICTFMAPSYEQMPPVVAVQALAESLRRFSFNLRYEFMQDPGTEFNERPCFFSVSIDWARDVYFIRKSDNF